MSKRALITPFFLVRLVLGMGMLIGLRIDAQRMPYYSRNGTWAGHIAHGGRPIACRLGPPVLHVTIGLLGVEVATREEVVEEDPSAQPELTGRYTYLAATNGGVRRGGLWAITWQVESRSLIVVGLWSQWRLGDVPPEVRRAAVEWYSDHGWLDQSARERLAVADYTHTTSIPGGRQHTVAALTILAIAILVVPWFALLRFAGHRYLGSPA